MLEYIFSWTTLYYLLLALYVPSCVGLIIIVLLQKGKGVGFAGAFGAGPGSEAVFGPRNIRSLPQKLTYTMATVFMVLAIVISIIYGRVSGGVAPEMVEEYANTGNYDALFDGTAAEEDAAAAPEVNVEVQTEDGAAVAITPEVTVEESADAPAETPEADAASADTMVEEAAEEVVEAAEAVADGADAAAAATVEEAAEVVVDAVETAADNVADVAGDAVEAVEEAAEDATTTEESAQ